MYKINKDLAEETGIHIGDGSMNIYNGVYAYTIACHHIADRRYMDEVVVPLYRRVYDVKPKTRNWSKGSYGFRVCRKKIIEFKRDVLNLPLGKKENIRIPQQILENNNFKRIWF